MFYHSENGGIAVTKLEAIYIISILYPADSASPETAEIGKQLLEQAKRETSTWRNEPENVLIRYAELCMKKENEK